jgi:hypothetical protein
MTGASFPIVWLQSALWKEHTHDTFASEERADPSPALLCVRICRPASFLLLRREAVRIFIPDSPPASEQTHQPAAVRFSPQRTYSRRRTRVLFWWVCVFAKEDLLPARILKMLRNALVSLSSRKQAKKAWGFDASWTQNLLIVLTFRTAVRGEDLFWSELPRFQVQSKNTQRLMAHYLSTKTY